MTNFESVKKFMETFGQEVKEKAHFPNDKITSLRYELLREELEDCKEAINMTDFIKSVEIEVDDLELTRKNGLCAGIQSIFINALKNIGVYKRPIHCTDMKRETLYIKDSNEWACVHDKRDQIRKPIAIIADKQRKSLQQWEKRHPNWSESDKGKWRYY